MVLDRPAWAPVGKDPLCHVPDTRTNWADTVNSGIQQTKAKQDSLLKCLIGMIN